ncbi:MAG TPA: glycerol-3-phosphate dehydrogenase/oxidase [Flavitalea sp.]|nr:glycerol-3-phosphate dehydrogenase/oxidase [Flavitalea sp.]
MFTAQPIPHTRNPIPHTSYQFIPITRQDHINILKNTTGPWDLCIIGGGATGLGTAVDAASRGYKTILFEQADFAKGTSSRSTKLVHGGVRYLQQGNIKLVMEALRERGILKKNAGHLVKNQSFIVPNYKWWEGPYYGIGLKVYDWMSGSLGLGTSELLSKEEVLLHAPTLDAEGLRGGVLYHDGQFDDARLAINLAQTAASENGVVLNYFKVTGFKKVKDIITAVKVNDQINGDDYEVPVKSIVNATGVFSDAVQFLDDPERKSSITPSQGIHLVLPKNFLPGDTAIMVPHTEDGRVLFAVPWHNRIIVGTTDTPVDMISDEPIALDEEIDFIVKHVSRYLRKTPAYDDIKSIFAGLRPLVKSSAKKTAALSRDHSIVISTSGLISVLGGKWTTYRKMAEDVVNLAALRAKLPERLCRTKELPLHGNEENKTSDERYYYGTDRHLVLKLIGEHDDYAQPLHPDLPYCIADIIWAVRNEYCMTVDDALSRRTRSLLLDAKAAIEIAPVVAGWMAKELPRSESWQQNQVESFRSLAKKYLPV